MKPNGGKKSTPAITVPQIRDGIAMLVRAAYLCDTPTQIANHKTRRLLRNEEARFYHYKAVTIATFENQPTSITSGQ